MAQELISNIKKLMVDLSLYTAALILGPLILFGSVGYFLDCYFQTKPIILIICFLLAVIISNVFIYRKVKLLNQVIKEQAKKLKKENNKNET